MSMQTKQNTWETSGQVHLPREHRLIYGNTRLAKAWTALDRLSVIRWSDLSDKIKRNFFPSSGRVLLYGCTTWTLTKRIKKKIDGNCTRMLRAVLNKSWKQHPTKQQLYGHLLPIFKTIQIRWTRHAGHCWRSKNELISDVLLWTPSYGRANVGRPARTYLVVGCSLEDLPEVMDNRDEWQRRVREIRVSSTTWCIFADCSADCLARMPDSQCFIADLRLGHLRVGELHHWHLCHLWIVQGLAVQFNL